MTLTQVGRYQIIRKIGQGGMATVYLAQDPTIRREVAIKIMDARGLEQEELRARFRQEAQTIASLDHPSIVPIYDYGEVDGAPFLVMRYMAGGSLADWIKQGPLPLPTILRVLRPLAGALDEAHRRGIIHRDLKPANILFDQRQEAFLSDFGIVKRLNASVNLTQGLGAIGTPAYMSPEQAQGVAELDGRSDVYALGIVLFEMLAGQRPFQAPDTLALMHAQVYDPVPPIYEFNPNLPPDCQYLIEMALAKQPEQRFASAGALLRAFEPIAQQDVPSGSFFPPTVIADQETPSTQTAVPGLSTTERIKRQIKRLPMWARLAILGLALIPLLFMMVRTLALSPAPTTTPVQQSEPTAVEAAASDPAATETPPPIMADMLVLLEWDESAVYQHGDALNRIPASGQIPLLAEDSVILQANAAPMEFALPDRTRLKVDANGLVQVESLADGETAVTLLNGRVTANPINNPAIINAPTGFYAEAESGVMGVEFDPALSYFTVDCLREACALVVSAAQRIDMAEGEAQSLEKDVLVDLGGARYGAYRALIEILPTPTPAITASATPTEMPTLTATPTAVSIQIRDGLQVMTIGQSTRGEPLEALRFGSGRRVFVLVGGVHSGYAPNTVDLAEQLTDYFRSRETAVPADATLYIIPNLNPDAPPAPGELAGRLTAAGVDPNRNSGCRWSPNPTILGSVRTGAGGSEAFSEPETSALRDFIDRQQPTAVLILAAHGQAYGVASPGACLTHSLVSVSLSKLYGRAAGYLFPDENNDGIVEADKGLTGDLVNWLDESGVPAIAVILPGYESAGYTANLAGLTAVLDRYTGPETMAEAALDCGETAVAWPDIYETWENSLSCPRNEVQRPAAAFQNYANGLMIWRGDTDEVYVLYENGAMDRYVVQGEVDYEETDLLKGAFGYVWQTKPGVSSRLGNPQAAERVADDFIVQDFVGGAMLTFAGGDGVYVLRPGQNLWEVED